MMLRVPSTLSYPLGLGDAGCCVTSIDPTSGDTLVDCSACPPVDTTSSGGSGGSSGGGGTVTTSSSPSLTAAQIAQIIAAGGSAAVSAINAVNAPAGYSYNANTGQYVRSGAAPLVYNPATGTFATATIGGVTSSASLTGSMLPVVLGLGALVLLAMVLKR